MDSYFNSLKKIKKDLIGFFQNFKRDPYDWKAIATLEGAHEKILWFFLHKLLHEVEKSLKISKPRSDREVILDAMAFSGMSEFLDPKSAISKYRNDMESGTFETLGIVILSVRKTGEEIYLDVSGSNFSEEQKLEVMKAAMEIVQLDGRN